MYRLFYYSEEPPKLPNLPKPKSADENAWGNSGEEPRQLKEFRLLLSRAKERDLQLLMFMAQKMAMHRKLRTRRHGGPRST